MSHKSCALPCNNNSVCMFVGVLLSFPDFSETLYYWHFLLLAWPGTVKTVCLQYTDTYGGFVLNFNVLHVFTNHWKWKIDFCPWKQPNICGTKTHSRFTSPSGYLAHRFYQSDVKSSSLGRRASEFSRIIQYELWVSFNQTWDN
jgi:hypothetical protein